MGRILFLKGSDQRAQTTHGYRLSEESSVDLFGKRGGVVEWVTPENCELISAVFCAITVLTNSVARLPLMIYRRVAGGKERADDTLVSNLFRRAPNPWTTPFEFKEMITGHLILRGNFYAQKYANRRGQLVLIPLHPDRVSVAVDADFGLTYTYRDPSQNTVTFAQDEIFHVKGLRSDGVKGKSVIESAAMGLRRLAAGDQYATDFFDNSATPSGVLTYPQHLDDLEYKNIQDSWNERHGGPGNRHKVAILEQGLQWQQLGISNVDAQILESRQYEISEVARWFNLPPHKLKDLTRSTNNNIEHQSREFHEDSALPWATRIQEHIDRCFFGSDNKYFSEFLYDSILVTDTLQRYQAHGLAIQNGWKTRNEIRALENLNPIDGLDDVLVPLNMGNVTDPKPDADDSDTNPASDSNSKRGEIGPRADMINRAFRRLYEEAFQRIVTAETKNLERCLKKPKFMAEVESFYSNFAEFCRNILRPITQSLAEVRAGVPDDYVMRGVDEHIAISLERILGTVGFADWQARAERLLRVWAETRARNAAEQFMEGLTDGNENDSRTDRRDVA